MPIMTEISDDQLFAELRKIDTPTITNVVATYPKNPATARAAAMLSGGVTRHSSRLRALIAALRW